MDTIIVSHQLPTMTSFGNNMDTGEGVFIPAHLVKTYDLKIGQTISATCVPNPKPSEGSPWMVAVVHSSQAAEMAQEIPYRQIIMDKLSDGFATTSEVAEALGTPSQKASDELRKLHKEGEICRADCYRTGDQEKASHVLWALEMHDITGD